MANQPLQGWQGVDSPDANFHQLPNQLVDVLLEHLTLPEAKVLWFIARHQFGFQPECDPPRLTLDEIEHGRKSRNGERWCGGTGLARSTIINALAGLTKKGIITTRTEGDPGRIQTWYDVKVKAPEEAKISGQGSGKQTGQAVEGSGSRTEEVRETDPDQRKKVTKENASKQKIRSPEKFPGTEPSGQEPVLPPRPAEYHGSFSSETSTAEESGDELPALIRLINAQVNGKHQLNPKSKAYKRLLEVRVKWVHVDPQANELWEYDFGSLCDHYDESVVFRKWIASQLKYAVSSLDSDLKTTTYHLRLWGIITNFQHDKFGYWAFRRNYPNLAAQPCEIRFRAAVKNKQEERQQYVPEFTPEDRVAALQYLTPEEVWYLRLDAIDHSGWIKMLSPHFNHTIENYTKDWGRNYPPDIEYGQPIPSNLTPGTQHVLGMMKTRAAEAKERILSEFSQLEYKP